MAWEIKYKCENCGYEAVTYEGKGLFGQHISAVVCSECHTIQPLVVGGVIGDVAPSFRSESGRLCLRCGSDRIRMWDGTTCPKCGGEMKPLADKEFWT